MNQKNSKISITIIVIIGLLALLIGCTPETKTENTTTTTTVEKYIFNNEDRNWFYPSIHVENSNIFVVLNKISSSDADNCLLFFKSEDLGNTWQAYKTIDKGFPDTYGANPVITGNNNKLFIMYYKKSLTDDSLGNLMLAVSDDYGSTWNSKSIEKTTYYGYGMSDISLKTEGNNLYSTLVCSFWVYLYKSTDNGITWNKTLIDNSNHYYSPSLAIDESKNVYIAYSANYSLPTSSGPEIKLVKEKVPTEKYIIDNTPNIGWKCSLFLNNSYLYFTYLDENSTGGGVKFGRLRKDNLSYVYEVKIVDKNKSAGSDIKSLAYDNYVFVVYTDDGRKSLKVAISNNCGDTWTYKELDKSDNGDFAFISVANFNKSIFITYKKNNGLKLKKSFDNGETWE
ncbi:MAG: hypothetical protein A2Y34_05585 [Spirochaetes bacterium GWC1_27_15]|nr:MAG: hypothetical protein A2Z98_07185 [Spirochaetes bacterium GWB1_27_13]OHD22522.1 MAG: hypothetical protein A2Y34_05585 [Spirochaetes bacterium GWC1_27_15]